MHETTLPLGRYAKDPRLVIVQVNKADAVRAGEYTIVQDGTTFQLWHRDEPGAIYPHHTERSLARALRYAIGDPQKVGPLHGGHWLHTDGSIYAHDPATTAMRHAWGLNVGDVVDFPGLEPLEVMGEATPNHDELGRPIMGYPVRRESDKVSAFLPFRDGDLFPVRTGRAS